MSTVYMVYEEGGAPLDAADIERALVRLGVAIQEESSRADAPLERLRFTSDDAWVLLEQSASMEYLSAKGDARLLARAVVELARSSKEALKIFDASSGLEITVTASSTVDEVSAQLGAT